MVHHTKTDDKMKLHNKEIIKRKEKLEQRSKLLLVTNRKVLERKTKTNLNIKSPVKVDENSDVMVNVQHDKGNLREKSNHLRS